MTTGSGPYLLARPRNCGECGIHMGRMEPFYIFGDAPIVCSHCMNRWWRTMEYLSLHPEEYPAGVLPRIGLLSEWWKNENRRLDAAASAEVGP